MKKIFIFFINLLFIFVFISVPNIEAASATYYSNLKSLKYSSSYNTSDYSHIGYYYFSETSGNTRRQVYSDLYLRDYYKVSYVGILGSPQPTYARPMVFLEHIYVDKLSFFISEELIHTNSLSLEITLEINDIKNGFGVTWSKVMRYAQGAKISTNVETNSDAPLVALVVYKIQARIYEVVHQGLSTRSWFLGSWSDYNWTTVKKPLQWVTIGYAGYFTFLGDGYDTDFLSGNYLIDHHPDFYNPDKFRTY